MRGFWRFQFFQFFQFFSVFSVFPVGRGPMKRIPHARGEHAGFASWEGDGKVLGLPEKYKKKRKSSHSTFFFFFPDFFLFSIFARVPLWALGQLVRPLQFHFHEANPACSPRACGNRFMGPRPPPMKRIPHAPPEHAGIASWGRGFPP